MEVIKTVTAESQASPGAQRVGDVIKQQSAQAAVQAARASERHTALQNSIARAEAVCSCKRVGSKEKPWFVG